MIFAGNRPLLEAYRRGERGAFAAVYREYVGPVIEILTRGFPFESGGKTLRFAGFSDPVELESCVQDVFVAVFSEGARHGYDGLRPFAPYVLQIARHRVIDELRRRRAAVARLGGAPNEASVAVAFSEMPLDEQLDREHARRLVGSFMAARSALEQRYVAMRFAGDVPLTRAARALGMSRMRARWLEARLLRELAGHLQSAGYLHDDATFSLLNRVVI